MASRGRQTFNKRLKEQQRKEKQQEKFTKRLNRPEREGGVEIASAEDDEIASEIREIKEEASRLGSDVDLTGLRLRINGPGGNE
jgi:hypothetical protein